MSSKFAIRPPSTRRWSLTARLTVFFGAAIAVIVIVVSAMMYSELVNLLHRADLNELLENISAQQRVLVRRAGVPPSDPPDDNQFAWELRAADGRVTAASATAGRMHAALQRRPPAGLVDRFTEAEQTFLLLDVPTGDGSGRILRGVLDVSQDERVVQGYLGKLLTVVLLAITAAAGLGWFLARRALAPLRSMNAQIARLSADRLHTRIADDAWPAELRTLAGTFDDLMGRIARSFEQLTRFSADLAHEIRSPMTNLVAAASVTLGRARSSKEYVDTLEIVVEEGGRLARMVSHMLFLARADNASQLVQREMLSTETEFATLVEFFGIVAEDQGVSLTGAGNEVVFADPDLLRQALSNLLTNALRCTPRGGTIHMSAHATGGGVAIRVSDSGIGIAPEHFPFLFERFFRVDPARSAPDSTGLGLALVRSIAELHGGRVDVSSTLGHGACFDMWLPART